MKNNAFFEKGLSANRNRLAHRIITYTIIGIVVISCFYFIYSGKESDSPEKIFNTLIPLFATWVGTVLAFYFGRENFEAASNRYEQIINRLSPDVLDDILINQIMISKKTMVSMPLEQAKTKSVKALIQFLESVNKSRLPILDQNKISCVVHKSTFLDVLTKSGQEDMTFDAFQEEAADIISNFIQVPENTILEEVRNQIDERSVKDVFVVDKEEEVLGWITDTLIIRYLKSK